MEGEGRCLGETGGFGCRDPAVGWVEGVINWAATAGEGLKVCMCEGKEGEKRVPQR